VLLALVLVLPGALDDDGGGGGAAERPAQPAAGDGPGAGAGDPAVGGPAFGSLRGEILAPPSATVLSSPTFDARLRVTGDPAGRHVWLAVQLRAPGYFPQPGERGVGEATVPVTLGPGVRSFVLVLVTVDDADHARILEWIAAGRASGARPALDLPSVRHLDEVALLYASG